MIDLTKLKKGALIRTKDGAKLTVRGSYMSTDGVIITANDGGGIVDRNVPIGDILEFIEGDK